jgi:hypothetical protein
MAKAGKDVGAILRQGILVDAALVAGVREALRRHRQVELPVAEWRDGRTVWLGPEEIEKKIKEIDQHARP